MVPASLISPKPLRVVLATGKGRFHPLHDLEVASVAYVEVCKQAARVAAKPPDCLIYDDLNNIVGMIDPGGVVYKGARPRGFKEEVVYDPTAAKKSEIDELAAMVDQLNKKYGYGQFFTR